MLAVSLNITLLKTRSFCVQVLPVELLHGFTFALAWGTGTAYSSWIAPPGLESTTQALFQGLYFGKPMLV